MDGQHISPPPSAQYPAVQPPDASAAEAEFISPMNGDLTCDVAIVGGGITGLSTALHAGTKISTGVHNQKLDRQSGRWILRTNRGVVTADTVILGANTYTDTLWPQLEKTFVMINYFQLATKPLEDNVLEILPGGQGLWDTGAITYFRA